MEHFWWKARHSNFRSGGISIAEKKDGMEQLQQKII
jgi:hypothetical protein